MTAFLQELQEIEMKKYYFVFRARSPTETHSQHSKRANYVFNIWAWQECAEKFKLNCLLSFFSFILALAVARL